MMASLNWYLDPTPPPQLKIVVKLGPPLTTLSGSAHELTLIFYSVRLVKVMSFKTTWSYFRKSNYSG